MKFILAVVVFALMLGSCATKNQNYANIGGQYEGDANGKEIHLCKVEHGQTYKVAVTKIGDKGYFGFRYAVDKPGMYVINVVQVGALRKVVQDHNLKRFYLDKGIEVELEMNDGSYQLINTNCDKNKLLSEWNNQVDTVYTYSHGFYYNTLDYTHFFPLLPGFVSDMEKFKSKIKTQDASFNELMELLVDTEMAYSAVQLLYTPRVKHPERADYPEYYDLILDSKLPNSERLLELPFARAYLKKYAMYSVLSQPEKPSATEIITASISTIDNDLLKGYFAFDNVNSYRSYDSAYLTFRQQVEPYLQNDYLKQGFKDYELTIRKFKAGATAFDFSGKDMNGKEYKLSDFKGNLVYVDVWATWCGPCKAQIPALKELEKKFHGQSITFLSISVDTQQNKQKWIDYVTNKRLKGVQLIADNAFESDVTKVYGINAIPRFMLIDKEGKIISADAPRPTDNTIEKLLKSHL